MKIWNLYEAGPSTNMKLEDVSAPTALEANDVLIKTKAISVNPVDYKARTYDFVMSDMFGIKERPFVLGWDLAGTVSKVGSDVTDFVEGDNVFGMVNFPGQGKVYAEEVVAPANHIAKMPTSSTFEEAAATTLAALTPLQIMEPRVKKGDTVLIHAGSGGTGHFAIQIAKALGAAKVIATSSAKNKDFCMKMGADEHIDYRSVNFWEVLSDVDFCFEPMGGDNITKSVKVLKDGGKIVTLPDDNYPDEAKEYCKEHNIDLDWVLVKSSGDDMKTLQKMMEEGKLKAHVSQTFKFDEMIQAHEAMESGRTVGKIIVTA